MVLKRFAFIVCATMVFASACASDSEKRDAYFEKGTSYVEEGRLKEALLEYKNSVKIDPAFTNGWVEIARLSMKQGNPKEAFRAYMKVVEKDPSHSDAHFNLAKLYMLAKKKDKAREHIDLALAKDSDNIEYLLVTAALFASEGNDENALEVYDRVLTLKEEDIRPYRGMARLRAKKNDFAGAEVALRNAIAIAPDAIRPRLDLVNLFNSSRQYDKAEVEMKAIVQDNSDNIGLLLVLGDFYSARKKYAEAEKTYLGALSKAPETLRPVMKLASHYEQRKEFDKAEGMYKKGLELKPDDDAVVMSMARFYSNRGALNKAEEMVDGLLQKNPGLLTALILKGELALRQLQFDSAVTVFTSVIAEDAKSVDGYYLRGVAYMALGTNDLARKDVLQALEVDPNHLKARVALAELYLKGREFSLAKDELEKVLDKKPYLYKANLLMGDTLAAMGEVDQAIQTYDLLAQQDPDNPIAFFRSGVLHLTRGDIDPAQENLAKARRINPQLMDVFGAMVRCHMVKKEQKEAIALCEDQLKVVKETPVAVAMVYAQMGGLYMQQGAFGKAEAAYNAAIEKNPNTTRPYYGLAAVYQRQGDPAKVVAQLQGVIEKNPKDPLPHVILGIMHEGEGDLEGAKVSYREALAIQKDIVAAANNLAYILADSNKDIDEALELARTAKSKATEDPNIMDTLGLVYYRKGLYESAISEFNDSLEKLPENATVNYHLGLALHANGNIEKAKKSLEKALALSSDFKGADEARAILAGK